MAVLKEFQCLAHGDFDGFSLDDGSVPACPKGCGPSMVQRVFRTAPAVQSAGYRQMNRTFDSLAQQHGLSNMSNRNAVQDHTGMRRADSGTYRRLNEATEMVVGPSKAGITGTDVGSFFKPLNQFQPGSTGDGGVLHRTAEGGVVSGAIPLTTPKAVAVGSHDGRQAGLPAGEA